MKTIQSTVVVCAFVACSVSSASAQTPAVPQVAPPPAVSLVVGGPAPENVLRVGTEVPLILSETLTTKGKKLRAGTRFRMETSAAVMVQGVPVIPIGSPAVGEITNVRNKGMWGKSGRFVARILYVTVNGRQIRLSGAFSDKGTAGGIGAAAVSAIVFLPAGFVMTGTSAKLAMGTPVKGFVDEDVPLTMVPAATSEPLAVPVPSAPASQPQ